MIHLLGLFLLMVGLALDLVNLRWSTNNARTGRGKTGIPGLALIVYVAGVRLGVGHFLSMWFFLLMVPLGLFHVFCIDLAARAVYPMRRTPAGFRPNPPRQRRDR